MLAACNHDSRGTSYRASVRGTRGTVEHETDTATLGDAARPDPCGFTTGAEGTHTGQQEMSLGFRLPLSHLRSTRGTLSDCRRDSTMPHELRGECPYIGHTPVLRTSTTASQGLMHLPDYIMHSAPPEQPGDGLACTGKTAKGALARGRLDAALPRPGRAEEGQCPGTY